MLTLKWFSLLSKSIGASTEEGNATLKCETIFHAKAKINLRKEKDTFT